ncbi:MAG: IS110 family transposase, partial [bacterium]
AAIPPHTEVGVSVKPIRGEIMDEYRWNVGIDWGSQTHQVCEVSSQGQAAPPFAVAHSNKGIEALLSRLETLAGGDLSQVAGAIEVPRGVLVEALVERGAHVYAINPKQADRFRDRISPAGAKDDSRDSFVLGDSVRTDRHCFRRVEIDSPEEIELREMGRADDGLGEELGRMTNRLRERLNRCWPGVLGLCPAAEEPWLWAPVLPTPTPPPGPACGTGWTLQCGQGYYPARCDPPVGRRCSLSFPQ